MFKKILIFAMALVSMPAFANDGIVFLGKSVKLIEDKRTNVAMREEEIVITLHKDYYEVDVSFKFYNDGPDEKVLVGFPVVLSGSGVVPERIEKAKKAILKSYLNGKLLSPNEYTIKEEYVKDTIYYGNGRYTIWIFGYTKWLLRSIEFKSKSHTESRVIYRMMYSNNMGYPFAGYTYGTGRSWKGPIGKMTVVVNHDDDVLVGEVRASCMVGKVPDSLPKPTQFIWEANGRYRYVFENVNPADKKDFIKIPIDVNDTQGEYNGQFGCKEAGLFFCRFDCEYECDGEKDRDWLSGSWHWHRALMYKDPSEIRLFTKNQFRLFINFFFAMHGYDFKNQLYKDYFRNMKSGWHGFEYKVNPNFSEKDFNDAERKNIDYLLKLEKMIPK